MQDLKQLNQQFVLPGQLQFKQAENGLISIEITTEDASAVIQMQGAHVTKWALHNQPDVIWLSEDAVFAKGKSIRGGVPICWPWFGGHGSDASLPAHGFARTVDWQLVETKSANGIVKLVFNIILNDITRSMWPYDVELKYQITIGQSLELELLTRNTGAQNFELGEALHSYFNVSDVRNIKLSGLDACEYLDKPENFKRKQQSGEVTINQEVDRVYVNTTADCVIHDPGYRRRIVIHKQQSQSTIVWNPWRETANNMGDLGKDGYLAMLCVESGNAAENSIILAPGQEHCLRVIYSVQVDGAV